MYMYNKTKAQHIDSYTLRVLVELLDAVIRDALHVCLRLTDKQRHALENLTVRYLYKTLEMFVGWITDCLYDFHELPFAVKRPLPDSVQKQIEEQLAENQLSSKYVVLIDIYHKQLECYMPSQQLCAFVYCLYRPQCNFV